MVTVNLSFELPVPAASIWPFVKEFSAPQWFGHSKFDIEVRTENEQLIRRMHFPEHGISSVHRLEYLDEDSREQCFSILKSTNVLMERGEVKVAVAEQNPDSSRLLVTTTLPCADQEYGTELRWVLHEMIETCAQKLLSLVSFDAVSQRGAAAR